MIKGSYLLGCRVSEIAVIRWKDIEALDDGGRFTSLERIKARTVRVSSDTLDLFRTLGRGEADSYVFPSPVVRDISLDKRLEMFAENGDEPPVFVHPHQLRHSHATHAVQRGVDVFTLQATLGHSSSSTTGHYVAANPRDSSSLWLG